MLRRELEHRGHIVRTAFKLGDTGENGDWSEIVAAFDSSAFPKPVPFWLNFKMNWILHAPERGADT